MSLNFNSKSAKQSIQEPGAQEQQLVTANNQLAQLQLQQLQQQIEESKPAAQRQQDYNAQISNREAEIARLQGIYNGPDDPINIDAQWRASIPGAIAKYQSEIADYRNRIPQLNSQIASESLQQKMQDAVNQNLYARVTGEAPILTAGQQQALDTMFNVTAGRSRAALQQSAQEAAQMRGMSIADSPIGNQYLAEARNLEEGLAGQKTQAALNMGQAQDMFNQNLAQFQAQLQQQAQANRMSLATVEPAPFGQQKSLLASRMPYMNTTTRGAGGGLSGEGGSGGGGASSLGMIAALLA